MSALLKPNETTFSMSPYRTDGFKQLTGKGQVASLLYALFLIYLFYSLLSARARVDLF